MITIGLLSDTHGWLDPTLEKHFSQCDEIWHAGDIGSVEVLNTLESWGKPTKIVFGNIDNAVIQRRTTEDLIWQTEDVKAFMTHIAGYPERYNTRAMKLILSEKPNLVICGHSHILKVIYDPVTKHLHVNPGACGQHGLHIIRTAVRFTINEWEIKDFQVIELGKRGAL